MKKKQKKMLARIIIAICLLVIIAFIPVKGIFKFLLYLIPYLVVGYDILIKAFKGILNRQVFDENFLMAIATVGALALGVLYSGDYLEAVSVMLFYQIGEFFQGYAVGKSRKNITELMDIRPDYANIEENGKLMKVDPDEVSEGSVIIVQPGEKIPIDGVVVDGNSVLDTSALTGESMPQNINTGDEVISGCINMSGVLRIKTSKEFSDSTVSKILDLVENASSRKSRSEDFIAKFAKVYTPIVCYLALALAVLPPLVMLVAGMESQWNVWLYRALTFLIMSCPCALVISIPLSFFAGIGGASRTGVLIKGSNYLEALSQTDCIIFDKTGTLTKGKFEVCNVYGIGISDEELLEYAAYTEFSSNHPISRSIVDFYNKEIDINRVSGVKEVSGKGMKAVVDNTEIIVGKPDFLLESGIKISEYSDNDIDSVVYVSVNNKYAGYIVLADTIKNNSAKAIKMLKSVDIKKTIMLTGDKKRTAENIAEKLGIDEVYSELLPQDKLVRLEGFLADKPKNKTIAYVGDGINDAPVLARADVGIAMGAIGSDAAIEAADIILMDDNPENITKAVKISRKCMGIVYQNIIFAIGIKVLCLILSAIGLANMWVAIFADVGVMVIAVLNAMRTLYVKNL